MMLKWFDNYSIRKPGIKQAGTFSLLLILALMLTIAMAIPVSAFPQMPYQISGNVMLNSSAAPAGVSITAKINGVQYASTITDSLGRYGYSPAFFRIPADDPATTTIEGGRNGDIVQLYVAGVLGGTTTFSSGSITEVDLPTAGVTLNISLSLDGQRTGSGWTVPLTVKLFTPGVSSLVNVLTATPIPNGTFNLTAVRVGSTSTVSAQATGITPGTYDLTVFSPHTLINVKRSVPITGSPTAVDMSMLKEGNADDNNIIDISDFGILALSFSKTTGQTGYDARADFDYNGIVDISDFGMLALNFNKVAPIEVH